MVILTSFLMVGVLLKIQKQAYVQQGQEEGAPSVYAHFLLEFVLRGAELQAALLICQHTRVALGLTLQGIDALKHILAQLRQGCSKSLCEICA